MPFGSPSRISTLVIPPDCSLYGIEGKNSASYHLRKIKTDRAMQSFLDEIRKEIIRKLNKL
jgi:hypothetical protein